MHASIDMNASLHAKRLRAYLICHFPFGRERHPRGCGCGGADAETHRVNPRLSSGPPLIILLPYNVPDHVWLSTNSDSCKILSSCDKSSLTEE